MIAGLVLVCFVVSFYKFQSNIFGFCFVVAFVSHHELFIGLRLRKWPGEKISLFKLFYSVVIEIL